MKPPNTFARRLLALPLGLLLAGAGAGLAGGALGTSTAGAATAPIPVFNSIPSPLPATSWSQAYGAGYAITEFGAEVIPASTAQPLASVSTTLESFACESGSTTTCVTGPGATFPVTITANLYDVSTTGKLGSKITSDTEKFDVPYRPNYNPACPASPYGGRWMAPTGTCAFAIADTVTFTHFPANVMLPPKFVVTFGYKTEYTTKTISPSAPVNSLNVALDAQYVTAPKAPADRNLVPPAVGTEGAVYVQDPGSGVSGFPKNTALGVASPWSPTTLGPTAKPDIQVTEVTPTPVTVPPPVTSSAGSSQGYYEVASDGGIFAFTAPFHGSMGGKSLNAPVVGMARDQATGGYYEVASDGGIFAFTAPYYGSMGGKSLNAPIVGMAALATGKGYYEVASDGGIFAFTAPYYGSMGGKSLNAPMVGMAALATGKGYYEVASDGGIFAFGTATPKGSMGGKSLNAPIVGMAVDSATGGYWQAGSDGGIFAFTAPYYGSMGGRPLNSPVVGIAAG